MATIMETLKSSGYINEEILELNEHTNILYCDIEYFRKRMPFLKGRTEMEVAMFAVELAKKCDISKMDYDERMDDRLDNIYENYKNMQSISR